MFLSSQRLSMIGICLFILSCTPTNQDAAQLQDDADDDTPACQMSAVDDDATPSATVLANSTQSSAEANDSDAAAATGLSLAGSNECDCLEAKRFYGPIDNLDAMITQAKASPGSAPDIFAANGGRLEIMKIEALTDLYRAGFGSDLKDVDKLASDFSDQLSHYSDAVNNLNFAQQHGAPTAVVANLAAARDNLRAEYSQYISDNGWDLNQTESGSALKTMRKVVGKKVAWPKPKKDRAYWLKQLTADLQELQTKQFDFSQLSSGIHKFRRFERWVFIKLKASNGLFYGDRNINPIPQYVSSLDDPTIPTKYSTLDPNSDVPSPVALSQSLVSRATGLIEDIGTAKDFGLLVQVLTEAYQNGAGMGMADAAAAAQALVIQEPKYQQFFNVTATSGADPANTDFRKKAEDIYAEFINTVNPALAAELAI